MRPIYFATPIWFFLPSGCSTTPELRVAPDHRFLEYTDGKPFLYLGDTAWELLHKLDKADTEDYLADRADKGFTIIQAVILAELDGLRVPNANGDLPLIDLDPTRPNPAYFEHVDWVVSRAASQGLFMGLLPTWGDKVPSNNPGAGPIIFTPESAFTYGRFLGDRYQDQPIIWIIGGDRSVDNPKAIAIWRAMARGLEDGHGGKHLMTFHPNGNASSSAWFHHDQWLDFNMLQSGHDRRYRPNYRMIEADLALSPRKPVVDGEPAYEGIPIAFWEFVDFSKASRERVPNGVLDDDGLVVDETYFSKGFFERRDVRVHLYWTLFSGAAGYTYGANAIWQMYSPGDDIAIPGRETWRVGLNLPGSNDISHIRSLFKYRPLSDFKPDQSIISGDNPEGPTHVRALNSLDGQTQLFYRPQGGQFSFKAEKFSEALFFNPRNSQIQIADCNFSNGIGRCNSPDADLDFVLIKDSSGSYR